MRTPLVILLLLTLSITSGQYLDLDISKLNFKELSHYSFEVDSIIDARKYKQVVGFVHYKKPYLYKTAALEQDLTDVLESKLRSQNSAKENLTITINRLFIYSQVDASIRPVLFMELNLGFLKKTDTGYVEVFQAVSHISDRNGKPKKFIRKGLEKSILNCFEDYEERKNQGKLLHRTVAANLLSDPNFHENQQWAIDSMLIPPHALYHSIYDLRDNTPNTKVEFTATQNAFKGYYPEGTDGKEITDVFAYYEGVSLYVKMDKRFVKGRFTDGEVNTAHYFDPKELAKYNNGMSTAAALGGLVGTMIYSSANEVPESKGAMHLNFFKGHSDHKEHVDFNSMEGEVLIYASSFLQDGDTVQLEVNGSSVAKLGRDQFYIHKTTYQDKTVHVCLSFNDTKTCESISPDVFSTTILKGILKRNGVTVIDQLHWSEDAEVKEAIKSGKAKLVKPKVDLH